MSKRKPPHLPAAEFDAAQEFLDWCRDQIGLPHWTVYVGRDGPCPKDAYGDCAINPTRYMAKVRLSPTWLTLDGWTQANCLIHEAIHVLHHQLTEVVHNQLPLGLPAKAEGAFRITAAAVDLQAERMADQLATALTNSLHAVPTWERIRSNHGLTTLHP